MGERTSKIKANVKEHPVLAAAATLVMILSGVNVTSVVATVDAVNDLATKEYVTAQLSAHQAEENKRLMQVEGGLNRIRAFTEFAPQIKDLLTLRCMGVLNLDATIATLETQFQNLAGEPYREQPCERLLAGR